MNPIKWINQTFEHYFPGQYASMVAHTLVCWGVAVGAMFVVPGELTLAITSTIMYGLYWLREGRQKRDYIAAGKAWTPAKELAAKSDVIGPLASAVSFWLTYLLMWLLFR